MIGTYVPLLKLPYLTPETWFFRCYREGRPLDRWTSSALIQIRCVTSGALNRQRENT